MYLIVLLGLLCVGSGTWATSKIYNFGALPKVRVDPWVRIENFPKTGSMLPGGQLKVRCEAVGMPAPAVGWFFGDKNDSWIPKQMNQSFYTSPHVYARAVAVLIVEKPPANPVYYTCIAQSGNAQAKQSVLIEKDIYYEYYPPGVKEKEVSFTYFYKTVMIPVGARIELPCFASKLGGFSPSVLWYDTYNTVIDGSGGNSRGRFKITSRDSLLLSNVEYKDVGTIKCVITDKNNQYVNIQSTQIIPYYRDTEKHGEFARQ